MPLLSRNARMILANWRPTSKLAVATWYLLALDLLLWILQKLFGQLKISYGQSLGGWVTFLSFVVIVLFSVLAFRWLKAKLLWRLRNRLIVTYVFIGVIPVILLVALLLASFYLFAGQFATFILTSDLNAELQRLDQANSAIAHQLASRLTSGGSLEAAAIDGLRATRVTWADRQLSVWLDGKIILNNSSAAQAGPPSFPTYLKNSFRAIVRDQGRLFLRSAETIPVRGGELTVLSSEPLNQRMMQSFAPDLGEITLYAFGTNELIPTYTAGRIPAAASRFDRQVSFPTSISVADWANGGASTPVVITVQTRASKLRERLFDASGEFASTLEFVLLIVAIALGVIELTALLIGMGLSRTVTRAVAQLYEATHHINRGNLSHRIPVDSNDQLAELANSFNSMAASLEKLIEEQKQKQRLENELLIAQEVQAQLFPQHILPPPTLEVYGFCRPARTVSGDYYDFLTMDADRLLLAVGDISGKGISAALLMATIHSAVRAYSLQRIPALPEPVAAGAESHSTASSLRIPEVSPAALLSRLNQQVYESTPAEKYATLFLSVYDARSRVLTYSNGGHLPPIILGKGRALRRLDQGGTVVGLFDNRHYDEASVTLRSGEIFLAYSDGVTEPENDFGEFGEQRLIELVRENRDLPLAKISEIVTAAVDDWIGANEQPDDVTLVLVRVR